MTANRLRVLVVDDDPKILRLMEHSLRQRGFECACAGDGVEAERLVAGTTYDAVVADLKMPNRNGHQLLCGLLNQPDRPVLIAHTGIVEPRLAEDLVVRGIDDVLFKPVDFGFLASKLKQHIDRRKRSTPVETGRPIRVDQDFEASKSDNVDAAAPVSLSLLNHKLSDIASILPISSAAIDVFEMTRDCDREISQIAAAIQRDPSLAAEVLRLANCAIYNSTSKRVIDLDQAVTRIGQERIGELALATSAFAAMTPELLPWLDVDLTWKRSIAAGILLELLVEAGGHQRIETGLMLSTIMHSLGRVALGMLFPAHYEGMIARCKQTGESLEEQERRVFPTPHTEVLSQLLAIWKVPSDVFLPLKFSLDDFRSLVRLSEPARTRTELVKLAIVLGSIAVGRWQDWDLVQLPSQALLARLRIAHVGQIIRQTRSDLQKLIEFHPGGAPKASLTPASAAICTATPSEQSKANDNPLLELLLSMGLQGKSCTPEELGNTDRQSLVNGPKTVSPKIILRGTDGTLVVTNQCQPGDSSLNSDTVVFPCSYGRLRAALLSGTGAAFAYANH